MILYVNIENTKQIYQKQYVISAYEDIKVVKILSDKKHNIIISIYKINFMHVKEKIILPLFLF